MADQNDNDPSVQVKGARYDLILKAARSLGFDRNDLDDDELEQLRDEAGQGQLELGGVSKYLREALLISKVIDIDAFAQSDWNNNKHPQTLAKLCRYKPGWARLAFADVYDRSDKYPDRNINRMQYEPLRDLAAIAKNGVTDKAKASEYWPAVEEIMRSLETRLNIVVCCIGDKTFKLSPAKTAALVAFLEAP